MDLSVHDVAGNGHTILLIEIFFNAKDVITKPRLQPILFSIKPEHP